MTAEQKMREEFEAWWNGDGGWGSKDETWAGWEACALHQAGRASAIPAPAPAERQAADASELEFNAKRLRRVVNLLDLGSSVPESDAELLDCMGSVLAMVARKIEALKAAPVVSEQPVPTMIYAKCGADRFKEDCKGNDRANCPVRGTAQQVEIQVPEQPAIDKSAAKRIATQTGWTPPAGEQVVQPALMDEEIQTVLMSLPSPNSMPTNDIWKWYVQFARAIEQHVSSLKSAPIAPKEQPE